MTDLTGLIKSYDVRGIVGEQLTEGIARAIGAAFADTIVLPEGATSVVIGHDMRDSGPGLAAAVAAGLQDRGVDVVRIGLCSTDGLYHATGALDMPGVMVTASHNPAAYNGMKMCRSRARAVGENTGLGLVRDRATRYVDDGVPVEDERGTVSDRDMIRDYGEFLRSLVPLDGIRPLKVVVDAGNAMAGYTVPAVLESAAGLAALPLEIVPLYFELDGTFPNHEPNPLEEENLRDLQKAVVEHGADLGLAFDGDADRCFVVDERGAVVRASAITALVGLREAARVRADGGTATVIHNLISSRAVPELLGADGITTVRSRVGHSFIKALMADNDAVFGGEHSAHFYFRDFFYADSGMLAALHVMAALGQQDGPLSEMLADYDPYTASGEINSTVADVASALDRIRASFGARDGVTLDEMDGLTVDHWGAEPRWWFNVRPSGTEPLLRLNVEAADADTMEAVRDDALAVIREA
ncbi:phosphomannomutase/phosphoglucomutase [Demequina capsici]|uniref:Phosphomannomutase/phosphoglucomutase n=1 Tax=Demequina capsici TaxID=3075620 RepID=A0AA96FC37_9MICO|nr:MULTISPECIES: phosphomannomutase/phosphoglucomutase [unclassified Demequina]WNM23878.1 phosphomannomutase/phosphoglucomutase [Demequina sp. OYTSA14]WNM26717.1 phosphomannomutase/phosphoglucomutase [Demequina sp. PMTSA13]